MIYIQNLLIIGLNFIFFTVIADGNHQHKSPDLPINNGPRDAVLWFNLNAGGQTSLAPLLPSNKSAEHSPGKKLITLSCDGFDPKVSIANMINQLRSGAKDTYNEILTTIKATSINMPGMIIQRAWPDWYSEFRRLFRAKYAKFKRSIQICNRTLAMLQKSGNLSHLFGFKLQEKAQAWQNEMAAGNVDPVAIAQKVARQTTSDGIVGFCGEKQGGLKQAPIRLMRDAIRVGFNHLTNKQCNSQSTAKFKQIDGEKAVYSRLFRDLAHVQSWAVKVFGGEKISFCKNNRCGSNLVVNAKQSGIGVLEEIKLARKRLFTPLVNIVSGRVENKQENLNKLLNFLQATANPLHPAHIDALREAFSDYDRGVAILKTAEELATMQVLLRTRFVHQLLKIGQRDAAVSGFYAHNKGLFNGLRVVQAELGILERNRHISASLTYPYLAALLIKAKAKETNSIRLLPVNSGQKRFNSGVPQNSK